MWDRAQTQLKRTVYFLGALAETNFGYVWDVGQPCPVSLIGLFDVIEFMTYEPSAYVWSPGYLVVPHGQKDIEHAYFVGVDTYEAQVNPSSYAMSLAMERDMDNHEEREYT